MKAWVLAGLFTVVTAPVAFAGEDTTECQLDETRRASTQRSDTVAPTIARPTVAQREVAPDPAPRPTGPSGVDRRRNGKRIPDAQLIGPRGAL
jgi:hypothetical protein